MATKELPTDASLLIDVLAKTDALFSPYRDFQNGGRTAPGSTWKRRKYFSAAGLRLLGGKADVAERMRLSRAVTQLTKAGLIERVKPRDRTLAVRLTSDGDEVVRSLCHLPGLEDCFQTMREMVAIGETDDAIDGSTGGSWPATKRQPLIRETFLAGLDYGDKDWQFHLSLLHKSLAPGLWRGWVTGHSDMCRRVCYRLTDIGLEILDPSHDEDRARMIEVERPAGSDEAQDRYVETYTAEIVARRTWDDEGVGGELGFIPLSASLPTVGELRELEVELAAKAKEPATP